ncbi:hypothetical protein [Paractinoplanes hotanensis]|uniref:Uncharacterized protein n=1 Tax=Paractinoplanes hotanensis TaxID=2906497 RepID=A0ABT0XU16_9ACTN|nr:hypothetical protein [Actinoplanes hotanensis]MCM4076624.1 hypothetical protein [Actinoplanes hotanensis]
MSLIVPRVLVGPGLVGSSDFRTKLDAEVLLALEIYCRHRVHVSDQGGHQASVSRSADVGSTDELILTGVAVPFEGPCRLGGWVLQVAGIPVHVTEASATAGPGVIAGINDRDPASDPEEPIPDRGAWVRVRGNVSVADGYVVDEVEQALQRSVQRLWRVHRIVRLVPTGYRNGMQHTRPQEVEAIRHTRDASSYLLDLVAPVTDTAVQDVPDQAH